MSTEKNRRGCGRSWRCTVILRAVLDVRQNKPLYVPLLKSLLVPVAAFVHLF